MDNKWKVAKTEAPFPKDILEPGKYQWQEKSGKNYRNINIETGEAIAAVFSGRTLRYREIPIIAPGHQTIMTNWFNTGGNVWFRVLVYQPGITPEAPYVVPMKFNDENPLLRTAVPAEWFAGMHFAEFPPEVKA